MTGQIIAENALDLVGITEDYPYDNRGDWIDQWNQAAGAPLGSSWCASFVTAVWRICSQKVPANPAACESWHAWIDKSIVDPQPGDMVLYNFDGGPIAHHCGILYKGLVDRILVVEGNTSGGLYDREGFGVFLKERMRPGGAHTTWDDSARHIVGFIRPKEET